MNDQPVRASKVKSMMALTLTILVNVVLPILTFDVLTGNGVGEAPALLISAAWPTLELVVTLAMGRRIDEFSVIILVFMALGVVSLLAFNSPRMLLVKDSAMTGLFGLAMLGSLLARRPMMFYFGRRFATDGTQERIAWWNGLWQYQGFRRVQRTLTVVWGVAFLGEAALRIVLSLVLPVSTMVVVTNTLPFVVLSALALGTMAYGKRSGRAVMAEAKSGVGSDSDPLAHQGAQPSEPAR